METIIEIHPLKPEFDPLAKSVRSELIEAGEAPKNAVVQTQRLYRIEGNLNLAAAENVANTLLVDPVVESVVIDHPEIQVKKKKATKNGGIVLDVWPKPGVTDPVGETVQKGIKDLGYAGAFHASSAIRYVFPKIKNVKTVENLAKKVLANELIHDLRIRNI